MAAGGGAEIIDLTTSDVEEIPAAQALSLKDVAKEAPRAQKKRKASAVLEEGEVVDSGPSRASSRVSERASERSKDGRGEGGKKRKQKKSKSASSSRNSPASQDKSLASKQEPLGGDSLFFVDVTPAAIAGGQTFPEPPIPSTSASASSAAAASPPAPQITSTPSLLLPAHVSITEAATDGDQPEPIHASSSDVESETESFIEYLDYNDQATGMTRYFDDRSEEAKKSRHVCKKCGAEGEHSTRDCPVLICLTCGVRDEHSTHSCPISKTCYNCGLKGHISSNCPNRRAHDLRDACQRCYSRKHNTHLCPSHWRIYEYVSDSERQAILEARERLRALGLGEGGEAYIAQDEWCYNCGDSGHLGDDCKAANFIDHVPEEPSAFSAYNTASGPFSDERPSTSSRRRRPREWENGFEFTDGHGFKVPSNVGERARAKDRKRMAERAQQADEDDEENWFNDPNRNIRIRGVASAGSSQSKKDPPTAPRSFKFAVNGVESGSKSKAPAKPERVSLQDRIGDRDPRSDRRDHRRDNSSSSQFRRSDRDDKRGKGKSEREWDRGKRYADPDLERRHWGRHDSGRRDDDRSRPGPRYHGGYGR